MYSIHRIKSLNSPFRLGFMGLTCALPVTLLSWVLPAIADSNHPAKVGTSIAQVTSATGPTSTDMPPSAPSYRVSPVEGKVSVQVTNTTRTPVTYTLLGVTGPQRLEPGATTTLELGVLPANISFYPRPKTYLRIHSAVSETPGVLNIKLMETKDLNANEHALMIHQSGLFFSR